MDLQRELWETLKAIDEQIEAIKSYAESVGIDIRRMQDTRGQFAYVPLLCARANLLVAIQLETPYKE